MGIPEVATIVEIGYRVGFVVESFTNFELLLRGFVVFPSFYRIFLHKNGKGKEE